MRRWLPLLWGIVLAAPVLADNGKSLLDFELRSLAEPERHTLERYAGRPMLMMFFEPQCSWCYRQFQALDTLQQDCSGAVTPVAVGINGDRRQLQQAFRRAQPAFPSYQASASLLGAIGGVPATPYTLVADRRGQPLGWLRGYVPADQLKAMLGTHFDAHCAG